MLIEKNLDKSWRGFMDGIILSSWGERFWAWLIDVLVIGLIWHKATIITRIDASGLEGLLLLSALLFVYWTIMEGYRGQSVGKMFLKIAVTGPYGESIRFRDAAVESFGKAFILPIDVLLSLIFFKDQRQRLFNWISNTIVIRLTDE